MGNSFFLPKGTTGRKKEVFKLHIQGLILMAILMVALAASAGLLLRPILLNWLEDLGIASYSPDYMEITGGGFLGTFTYNPMEDPTFRAFHTVLSVINVLEYIVAIGALAASIVLIVMMTKRCKSIVDESSALENPEQVRKAKYVWFGLLLGAYGAHLFVLGKKKAWIFLGLGILGAFNPIFFIYTSGISFADALLAAYIPKDAMGMIDLEYYPHWL